MVSLTAKRIGEFWMRDGKIRVGNNPEFDASTY